MFLSLIAVSGFFKIADHDHDTRVILIVIFSILFYVFFYSIGAGPIPFTLSAEVFPLCVRGKLIPSLLLYHQRGLINARGGNELQCYDQFPWPWDFGTVCASVDLGIQGPGKSSVLLLVGLLFPVPHLLKY